MFSENYSLLEIVERTKQVW